MAYEAWRYRDPALVLERKQEQEHRQHARSAKGRAERARQGIEQLFKETPMTQDESAKVEDLLLTWYRYEQSYRPALSGPKVSAYARDYRTSETKRHGLDANDDADMTLERITAEAVGACVEDLHYLERAAICVHFRNRQAGSSVHRNPRLGSVEDQHTKYLEAKGKLWPMLKRRGMVR